ncbi:uncharacterized protein EI97DRAFT_432259 [Westerdykella ornata]|uniref:Snf7-domain-containing protein n=1 Tax=Westerdykella ornata TaxID=318751 RepID=A0A6A6JMC7_WESOR|nr:uncharacterized protein EI97DRAFT_432259 [Westerdykella ornata]KAF2277384.1 hypothetical protein EI97DRAFT_432259 [Westerdykella ornata]
MSELLQFILQHEEAFKSRNRLASLYADFRTQLNTNPDGYHANISAWKKALADAARHGVIPAPGGIHHSMKIRTGEELLRALQHPTYGRPTCLSAVFQDAVSKKEFLPLHEFLHATTSIYKHSWVPSPLAVVKWGLRHIGVLGQPGLGDKLGIGEFVVLSNVEVAATEIITRMKSHTFAVDRIMSRADFHRRFADALDGRYGAMLSDQDLDVILVFLARDKQAIAYDGTTIKFKASTEALPTPIAQEDEAIAKLRDTLHKINAQLQPLQQRVEEADATVREAVKTNQLVKAKVALRSKKLAEAALQQRTDVALQLEAVYSQLQHAADHVEVVEAMKQGAVALKALNLKVGGAEGVAAVVDTLNEEMATTDEISAIINETGAPLDEGEIDDELEALETAEREKREQEEKAERERKEREEAAEREKREQAEAAETAAKLAELEQYEKEVKEKAQENAAARHEDMEQTIEGASQDMSRLSFHQEVDEDEEAAEQERVPVPA